MKIVAHS